MENSHKAEKYDKHGNADKKVPSCANVKLLSSPDSYAKKNYRSMMICSNWTVQFCLASIRCFNGRLVAL